MVKIFMFILQIKIVLLASKTYFQEKGKESISSWSCCTSQEEIV